MKAKLIEVLDRMTFIPVLAVEVSASDGFLARRAGYGTRCIVFGKLSGGLFAYDPYQHGDRTMTAAHDYVERHWDELESGAVVDVEYVLGETKQPKRSEVAP